MSWHLFIGFGASHGDYNRYFRIVWNTKMKHALILFATAWLLASAAAHAAYPARRIEVVAAGNAGGGLDAAARALDGALHEAKLITQPMVINNMGGAAGDAAKAYVQQTKKCASRHSAATSTSSCWADMCR
jgi:tripartite-type tricarboxylate transporter receptor subunit TctC